MVFKIVTVATHEDGYLPALRILCKKSKIPLHILGYNQKWKGWNWRTQILIDFFEKCDISDIVMVIDGFDVLVLSNTEEIIKKFKKFKCNILFACSHVNVGQPYHTFFYKNVGFNLVKNYFKSKKKYILNAGSFMGYSKHILQLYYQIQKKQKETGINDDQVLLNNLNLNFLKYKIDFHSKVFWIWENSSLNDYFSIFIRNHTLEHNDYIHYIDGRIVFDKNKNKPCVVHGINNRVLDNLCYKNNIILTQDHIKNISQGDVKNILYYSKIFILVIIIIFMIYFLKKR